MANESTLTLISNNKLLKEYFISVQILQHLQRAHRCAVSQPSGWENEINSINHILSLSNKLANSNG